MTLDEFVAKFMPNLSKYLWEPGVKFSNYYTAASDCTAARATIHTGLYGYQTYSMLTLITYPPNKPTQPILHKDFPTIGKLMGQAGYQTPYFGKWHLSYDVADLTDYGYTSFTPNNDYVGYAGEGQGTDEAPAYEAAHWVNDYFRNVKSKESTNPAYVPQPFFLTLNFVNPHDKQWFWGAMEADRFYDVYKRSPPKISE
jgi:arylsulfatase A-like enzyme